MVQCPELDHSGINFKRGNETLLGDRRKKLLGESRLAFHPTIDLPRYR